MLLFEDERSAHKGMKKLQRAFERVVFLFFLVSNASQLLQPLDAQPCGVCHRLLRAANEAYRFDADLYGKSTRNAFLSAAFQFGKRELTPPRCIQGV